MCAQVREEPVLPPNRCAGPEGTQPWLDAILAARLPQPLNCAQFNETLAQWRGRYGRRLLSAAEFDEAFYLRRYPDVSEAISVQTVANAYAHYRNDGFREGRQGCSDDVCDAHNEPVWANLLHTLGDLRTAVGNQARHLESLKARRAIRLAMKRQEG